LPTKKERKQFFVLAENKKLIHKSLGKQSKIIAYTKIYQDKYKKKFGKGKELK